MRRPARALGGMALVAVLALVAVACRPRSSEAPAEGSGDASLETLDIEGDEVVLRLLFPGPRGRLYLEERPAPAPERRSELVRLTVSELFAGPSDPDLLSPFPPDVGLADVLVTAEGIAYVDLGAPHLSDPPPSGSRTELLEVYSIVNSVLMNVSDLRGVVLLWNGVQRPTFAGHLDTSRPLRLKEDLIARSG